MTIELSTANNTEYALEVLREGTDFTFFRGKKRISHIRVLGVAAAGERPVPQSLRRLEHEYTLMSEIDAAWAARPLELTRHQGRTILILEDPGGEPLDRIIERQGRFIDLPHVLRIAIGLAKALGQAHRQGLIHKDIKPANVLADEGGRVWLTGFGIASRLRRERPTPEPPEIIAGTFAYMSPEQTGRMNRSIDTRSDLYSLGVTLYEMLTGIRPFAAADAAEWVHCHIAREPLPPSDRCAVPQVVSDIIMKLLAKNAEERYQTAAGLGADLRRCLSEWESRGNVSSFFLGADDVSDRFLPPEKLYGREHEVDNLLTAFERVVKQGAAELVLVCGYSGIGKSSVVNELHKSLVPSRAFFAAGKFDQYKRDVPYATLIQAFQGLVRQILSRSDAELQDWRAALGDALGSNGRLIADLIPELELVIGKQPPVADLAPQDARRRFQAVLRRFIGVFARPQHPLVLFLDDLQWVDVATLDLLEDILTQGDIAHLLMIGAYRNNEVGAAHPLLRKLEAIRRAGATVLDIVLPPLTDIHLGQLISDALRCDQSHALPLTQLVQEKTGGNPFFAVQFLHALEDEMLLIFDHADARWSWDLLRIRAKGYSDNVVDLMAASLIRLPPETSSALCQLACVGSGATFALLATVCQTTPEVLHENLWDALQAGLVLRSEDAYAFRHDRIQEAAYSLIPEDARAEAHLRIGRLLLAHTMSDKYEEIVFEIIGQFNRSATLITAQDERDQVARLNLIAGKRARKAAAYSSALTHFAEGRALLAEDCWALQYPLVFELELHRAEAEFLTGETASAEQRLSMLAGRATSLTDKAAVACLHMDLYTVLSTIDRAVAVCLEYLQGVGVEWSSHPTDEDVRQEYEQVWRRLGTRQIEDLIDLPLMNDAGSRATLDVLTKAMASSQSTDPNLFRLMVAYMVNLSLNHGNSDASCCAYVWFGWVFAADFADYAVALRFGQLSIDLVDKRGLDRFAARVYLPFAIWISPRLRSVRSRRALILRAFDEAEKAGDLMQLGACHHSIILNSCFSGAPLDAVERDVMAGLDFSRTSKSGLVAGSILSFLYLIRSLRGLPNDLVVLGDEKISEEALVRRLDADQNLSLAACSYWIRRLQTCVFMGGYADAAEAALKAQGYLAVLSLAATFVDLAEYHFYAAMARAGAFDLGAASPDERHSHLEALTAHHRQLKIWAEDCPENLENRAALLGAEIARLEARDLDAERLYEQAIRSARANGYVHTEALACETAARFYAARGFEDIAEMYLSKACDGYRRWGADGKVRQLEARHPGLVIGDAAPLPDQQLDVTAVVKASQALSGEMLLPRLIERLMTIALQNAGAERGLLILVRDGELRIEAEAATGLGKIEVAARQSAVTPSDLPESVLHYAIRTQGRVLLDDASTHDLYSNNEYVRLKRSRSVLCLPILKQAKLVGALYLENHLVPGAFTPDRVVVLELLASQAAISLENAALYTDLQLQVGVLQHLPVSAWTLRPDGTPDFVNQVWLEFAGQTPDLVRSHPDAWMTVIHPEDRETAIKVFWAGVHSGQDFAFETRSLRARDGTYRWHLQQAVALRDTEGNVLKFVGTTTDIDDQKRTEAALRQTQADLAHVERVATLSAMTASIVHEVSQPLAGILTNANTGARMLAGDPPNLAGAAETVRRTIRDAKRASDVLSRIRAMFSNKPPTFELVDLNDAAREVIALSSAELEKRRAVLQIFLAADLPPIRADRVQLQQVILNLLLNASDAMTEIEDRPRTIRVTTTIHDHEHIELSVRDSGMGVNPLSIEKLFEAFYTTKPHGMGIGLSICRSIIESHNGRLWAEVNDGPGATFSFRIPGNAIDRSTARIALSSDTGLTAQK
jgi:PAS domain S-box-containing protein